MLQYTLKDSPMLLTAIRMQIFLVSFFCLDAHILLFALNPVVVGQGFLSPANMMQETPGMRNGRSTIKGRQLLLLPRSMVASDHMLVQWTAEALNMEFTTITKRYHHH